MNDLEIFKSEEFGEVRVVEKDGEPWFIGKDVCLAFGDKNPSRSLGRISEEDRDKTSMNTSGGKQDFVIINESGLYSLLFQMQPQKANTKGGTHIVPPETQRRLDRLYRFKKWVTSEVLPSIRKTGAYFVGQNEMTEEEIMAHASFLQIDLLKKRRKKRLSLKQRLFRINLK